MLSPSALCCCLDACNSCPNAGSCDLSSVVNFMPLMTKDSPRTTPSEATVPCFKFESCRTNAVLSCVSKPSTETTRSAGLIPATSAADPLTTPSTSAPRKREPEPSRIPYRCTSVLGDSRMVGGGKLSTCPAIGSVSVTPRACTGGRGTGARGTEDRGTEARGTVGLAIDELGMGAALGWRAERSALCGANKGRRIVFI